MKLLPTLLLAGVIAAGGATLVACADNYYDNDRGYESHHHGEGYRSNDYDRDDPRFRGYDSDYGDYGSNWTWRGQTRYCRASDGSFQPCGSRR